MFKGIKKLTLSLLTIGFVITPAYEAQADSDFVGETLAQCRRDGGDVKKEQVGDVEEVTISDTEKKIKTCYKVLCYRATANISAIDFDSIDDFYEQITEAGAAVIAFEPKVCKEDTVTIQLGRIGGLDDVQTDGDGDLDGGVSVRWDGETYNCDDTSNAIVCLRRNGIDIDFDYTLASGGRDGSGRRIYTVNRGGGKVGGDGSINGGGNRGGGVDISVGGDIDLDTDGRGNTGFYRYSYNGRDLRCMVGQSVSACLKDHGYSVNGDWDRDNCVHCGYRSYSSRSSGGFGSGDSWSGVISATAELAGAILPPVMAYKGQKAWANAYLGSNTAWAGAAATGFEQCQIMQTGYVDATYNHITANELPDREVMPPECNGYQLNGFAGMQGGGWGQNGYGGGGNSFLGAGYTSPFMQGFQGPYINQGYNAGINVTGGGINPLLGLGLGLLGGGGAQFNLGLNAGGAVSPYGQFGSQYGQFGNQFGGQFGIGNQFGGQFGNQFGGQFGINAGINPSWQYNAGPYGNSQYNPYSYAGGQGMVPPYNPYAGSYFNATGGAGSQFGNNQFGNNQFGNNQFGNNSVNGQGWWQAQQSLQQNQQAASVGSQYQQLALQNQAYNANRNMYYGSQAYGGAPYAPGNLGGSLQFGYNLGWQ